MVQVQHFFDEATFTLTYVVYDDASKDAVVIDPVLDYDPASGSTRIDALAKLDRFVADNGLRVHLVLETHAHADHLTGSQYLRRRHDARVCIGRRITEVQRTFKPIFALSDAFAFDGSQFDHLVTDGEILEAGSLQVKVIETPGHTPACVSYAVGDAVFTGDALFIEDYGTGRCDFPAGSADTLYTSVHERLYKLPDETRVYPGHDYLPNGRALRYETTIAAEKATNVHLRATTTRAEFVEFREARDKTLAAPRLLLPSVRINVDAGRMPKPDASGIRHISVPLNLMQQADDTGAPIA